MKRRRSVDALTLDEVSTRFENWRQNRRGKLRIHWKGATSADVAALSRALWDVAS